MELKAVAKNVVIAVALLFVLGGFVELGGFLVTPHRDLGQVLFGALSLATGIGLIRHSESWRKFALVALSLELAGTLGLAPWLFTPGRSPLRVGWPGNSFALSTIPAVVLLLVLATVEVLSVWALTRSDVKAMFLRGA